MRTYKVGIVSVAILLAAAGFGFGIAQAEGPHSDGPVLSFEEQAALEQGGSSSSHAEDRPVLSFEEQEHTQMASPAEEMPMEGPVETGTLPEECTP